MIDKRIDALAEQLSGAILSRSRGYLCEWYDGPASEDDGPKLHEFLALDLFALKLGAWAALEDDGLVDLTTRKVAAKLAAQTGEDPDLFRRHVARRHAEYKAAARGHTELDNQIEGIALRFRENLDDPPAVGWITGIFSLLLFSSQQAAAALATEPGTSADDA